MMGSRVGRGTEWLSQGGGWVYSWWGYRGVEVQGW